MSNHVFTLTGGDLKPAHLRGLPDRSWWAEYRDRDTFFAQARDQQPRMATSTIGKSNALTLGKNTERICRADTVASDLDLR